MNTTIQQTAQAKTYRPEVRLPIANQQRCQCGRVMKGQELTSSVVGVIEDDILGIDIPKVLCMCGRELPWEMIYRQ